MVLAELSRTPPAGPAAASSRLAPAAESEDPGPLPYPGDDLDAGRAPDTAQPLRTLLELSREAAQRAERQAIEAALLRVRWNRKRAAQDLGVSYKTLLNKMKECGISQARE
jgi:two-component system response regulator AtoC